MPKIKKKMWAVACFIANTLNYDILMERVEIHISLSPLTMCVKQILQNVKAGQHSLLQMHEEMRRIQKDTLELHQRVQQEDSDLANQLAAATGRDKDLQKREVSQANVSVSKQILKCCI